jgi:predicted DNA-binding transcriptional regulator AlpA
LLPLHPVVVDVQFKEKTVAKKADVPVVTDSTTDGSGYAEAFKASLPFYGFTRWEKMELLIPLSRETIRKLEKAGRFPRRVHLTPGAAAWPNSELHRWRDDPGGYRAPVSDADPAKDLIALEKRSLRLARLHAADQVKKAAKAKSVEPKADRSTIRPVSRPAKTKSVETAQTNQRKAAN